ncbi:double-strand break repair helicase AddA [Oceaniglobus ichthyenteri]|uniref:double-strand break repair helicase AddA n=1 Tax=Oceaniglobus ichthyenteri TaxID=2136177 RepID=UPI000D33A0AB|nr:double-strand break repair helicase AddA [Oceaniglobus ichthyenteri]
MTPLNEATARQIQAAHPGSSTWLSANAGSGKTRVLTDRVARLLLDGASPQNILCLTYTKAAASEMQNRLFKRLGEWAMTPDGELRENLAELGVSGDLPADRLALARTLFARAIETPGGLKIQTIHSFCAALLRRFPLEAGVSPQFSEMDERAANLLTQEIVEEMSDTLAPDVIDTVARHYTAEDFTDLTREIAKHRDRFFPPQSDADIRAQFDIKPGYDMAALLHDVFDGGEADLLHRVAGAMAKGTVTDQRNAAVLARVAQGVFDAGALGELEGVFLFGAGAKSPFGAKIGTFPTKKTQSALGDDLDHLNDLMERVADARETRLALMAAEKSIALHQFAQTFLPLYEHRKLARGWLDFDDLILKARGLMTNPALAAWVLYRLDGGIDHVLVDEAQDTSPTQWRVVELLTQEFTAGMGARSPGERSLFVVGDRKQSIYSFQGADPKEFERMFAHFAEKLAGAAPLQRLELEYSFRSSAAILNAVDAVFGSGADDPLSLDARHKAFHETLPGRVDLWPVIEKQPDPEDGPWYDPVDRVSASAADVQLAHHIAAEIKRMIDEKETIPAEKGTRRPVRPGDFLILVQRRKRLFSEIIRACKAQNLDIAGADRLKLGAELAVRDLRALLAFLATPEDDYALACALRSPLFGWSEQDLFALAAKRSETYLWQALRNKAENYPETMATINDLRRSADFLRPYDLLERILLRHHGRINLLGRLGPEAQDGLDELLNQALAYERMDIPSLTGFLAWLDADDVDVKRQADSAGNRIRVMTVHGAKGLEAPIVILPDTLRKKSDPRDQVFAAPDGTLLWRTKADDMPTVLSDAKAQIVASDEAERARLLYVAMTRAETWLIICGAGDMVSPSWYEAIEAGLETLPCETLACPTGEGIRHSHRDWAAGAVETTADDKHETPALPGWLTQPAPHVAEVKPISPSNLGGAKALPGETALLTQEEQMARGTDIHLLLEHLPTLPAEQWITAAHSLLGPDRANDVFPEVQQVLNTPTLGDLFAPGALAEVAITAQINGLPLYGNIDRLIVTDDAVLAIDYKSNTVVPETPEAVPDGLLRQMGAYAAALAQIYPDHRIDTAILWTKTATLMPLPHDIVTRAFEPATTP